jgi:hypothetical protein
MNSSYCAPASPTPCATQVRTAPVRVARIRLFGPLLRYVIVEGRMGGCDSG